MSLFWFVWDRLSLFGNIQGSLIEIAQKIGGQKSIPTFFQKMVLFEKMFCSTEYF